MNNLINQYIKITIELILVAVVLGVISLFTGVSNTMTSDKETREAMKTNLTTYRELYPYDNKVVTGNDILLATQKFKRYYDFYIDTNADSTLNPPVTFNFTGDVQFFTAPSAGTYLLEVWGAQGGGSDPLSSTGSRAGLGGYSKGEVNLTANQKVAIYVGGKGTEHTSTTTGAGWNGGGSGGAGGSGGFGGGGASDIRQLSTGGVYSLGSGMSLLSGTLNNSGTSDNLGSAILALPGQGVYGPYIQVTPGVYQIDVYGTGLNNGSPTAYTDYGTTPWGDYIQYGARTESCATYYVNVPTSSNIAEFGWVSNNGFHTVPRVNPASGIASTEMLSWTDNWYPVTPGLTYTKSVDYKTDGNDTSDLKIGFFTDTLLWTTPQPPTVTTDLGNGVRRATATFTVPSGVSSLRAMDIFPPTGGTWNNIYLSNSFLGVTGSATNLLNSNNLTTFASYNPSDGPFAYTSFIPNNNFQRFDKQVITKLTDRVIVAGGGGGGSYSSGGYAGDMFDGSGGEGGGLTAGDGFSSGMRISGTSGTQSSGYALGLGQSASIVTDSGGAGGGYYGGKVIPHYACGGGGGSSYTGGLYNSSTSSGLQSGNGQVHITYLETRDSFLILNDEEEQNNLPDNIWSTDWLLSKMGNCIDKKYKATLIWATESGEPDTSARLDAKSVVGIKFVTLD